MWNSWKLYMFCDEVLSVIKTETHTKGTEPQYQGNDLTATQRHDTRIYVDFGTCEWIHFCFWEKKIDCLLPDFCHINILGP